MRALLDLYYGMERRLRKLHTWAHLYHDQNIADDEGNQCLQRIMARYHDFSEAMSWIEPKILSHTPLKIQSFLTATPLDPYRTYMERLVRLKPHTLPEDQETIIAMAGRASEAPHKAFSAISDADFRFDDVKDSEGHTHPLTHASYGVLLRSPDRTLRKNAFETLHKRYEQYENTMCELLQGQIQRHFFEAKTHNYSSCLEAALFPKNIPLSVYHSLIATVREHIDLLHRYVHLKKQALHLTEVYPWDLYVPVVPDAHPVFTFDQAVGAILLANRTSSGSRKGSPRVVGWTDMKT